jgi:hypothetical protein
MKDARKLMKDDMLSFDDARSRLIEAKWKSALGELKRYSTDATFEGLLRKGKLKMWIVIFCAHRCLVNQEISDPDTAMMEWADFEWWFDESGN